MNKRLHKSRFPLREFVRANRQKSRNASSLRSRRYSRAQGGKLEIPPAQKLSILSSAHRAHGSAHTNVFALENQSGRELLIMILAGLQCSKRCQFKVAPYSLVQFINYLYRSATSDVILTTCVEFSWFGKHFETSRGKLFLSFFMHQSMAILRYFSNFFKVKKYVCFNQFLIYIF